MALTPAKPSAEAMKEIMDTTLDDPTLDAFAGQAVILAGVFAGRCDRLDQTTLDAITLQLAAHLASSALNPQTTRRRFGDSERQFAGNFGSGLDATSYGQAAKLMDPCGVLDEMSKSKRRASFTVASARYRR